MMPAKSITGLLTFCFAFSMSLTGQGDSLMQQVKTRTTYEYFVDEGLTKPVVEQIRIYDNEGQLIEEKEFNKRGEIRNWEKWKYDSAGNIIMHITLDSKGEQEERINYAYRQNQVIEKLYYDHKDRLYKRKVYKYEYHE